MKEKKRFLAGGVIPSILSFFVLWEIISRVNQGVDWMNPTFLPTPTSIVMRAIEMAQDGLIIESIVSSTTRLLIGFLLGCVSAILVGMILSRYVNMEKWISPILNMVGPIPSLALLPLFIIWFGIGEMPKILLIAWTTFFPVLTYVLDGLRSVNVIMIRSALSLGASNRHLFGKIIFPSALPYIFVGVQVSLALAFSALVVSEMMGAKTGLGYLIVDARNFFKIQDMFVAIVLIGVEYSVFSILLKTLERKVTAWRRGGLQDAVE